MIPHLFKTEYRKIVAVLCKRFGFAQVEVAEDIASDTFLTAAQVWGIKGMPDNPVAWLYSVAKNKAINHLQRQELFEATIAPAIGRSMVADEEIDLSPQNINDSQLQMMFAICHPAIPVEAQIGLALRILCGFGIEEIAAAFLTNKETINKRLYRAKEKLREAKIAIGLPGDDDIEKRLAAVLQTIYLLFNEGYYSVSHNQVVRKELCLEAMRLCYMLVENTFTNRSDVNALLSLMCFHASRLDARIDAEGHLVLYHNQHTSLWNTDLISKGGYFLHCAATGNRLSKYHIEASIAYWSTQQADTNNKWQAVLQLYNQLLMIDYSPIAALNRTFAFAKVHGKQAAIMEAEKLPLTGNQFYYALLGELYSGIDNDQARMHFDRAMNMAKTEADKQVIWQKIKLLQQAGQ